MPDIGKAYVQIVPSEKGISGSISKMLNGEADNAGNDAGNKVGTNLVSTLKKVVVAAGIGKVVTDAISAGADLEQSIGGIETLFGTNGYETAEAYAAAYGKTVDEVSGKYKTLEAAQTLALNNANNAYETAGLSANDYMQTVTSFAAALKGSTANELEAAQAADKAVIAMADNANKMGTDMESIQNAYQGFAKQNYTMLDNLKLGYGGTKGEMERLLADATKLTGVKYDINNLADVYGAIQVIQDKLGITGTTAKEAASTFSGSLNMLKSSWQNVLAAMTLGEGMDTAMEGLGKSLVAFGGNALRMIGNMVKQIPTMLASVMTTLAPQILPMAQSLITSLAQGFMTAGPQMLAAAQGLLTQLQTAITTQLPMLLQNGVQIINGLVNGILSGAPQLLATGGQMLTSFVSTIVAALPQLLSAGMQIIMNLVSGLGTALPQLITVAGQIITNLVTTLMQALPQFLTMGVQMLTQLVRGILATLPTIISTALQVIAQFVATVLSNLPQILQTGIQLLGQLIAGVINAIPQIPGAISQVINSIKSAFSSFDWASIGKNILEGIKNGILNAVDSVVAAAKSAGQAIFDGIKGFFNIGSPSKLMADEIGRWIPPGIAVGFEDSLPKLNAQINSALNGLMANASMAMAAVPVANPYANMAQMAALANQPTQVNVVLQGDAAQIFKVVQQYNSRRTKATGYNGLALR